VSAFHEVGLESYGSKLFIHIESEIEFLDQTENEYAWTIIFW